MAEPNQSVEHKEHKVTTDRQAISRNPIVIGAVAIIVLLAVFFAGRWSANHPNRVVTRSPFGAVTGPNGFGGRRFGGGFGRFGGNSANRVSGVVTSVNGGNFTLAGNGSTTNVVTNSSTQFTGDNQVSVNDTVLVFGTSNNGTFTATQVIINPSVSGRASGPAV